MDTAAARMVHPLGRVSGAGVVARQLERRDHLDGPAHEVGSGLGKDPGGRTGGRCRGNGEEDGRLADDRQDRDAQAEPGQARPPRSRLGRSCLQAAAYARWRGNHGRRCLARGGGARQQCGELRRRRRWWSVGHHPHVIDEPGEGGDVVTDHVSTQRLLDGGVELGARGHVGEAIVAGRHRGTPSCSRRSAIAA
jgi:hypothetical protein